MCFSLHMNECAVFAPSVSYMKDIVCVCTYSQSCQLDGRVCGLDPLASQRCWD